MEENNSKWRNRPRSYLKWKVWFIKFGIPLEILYFVQASSDTQEMVYVPHLKEPETKPIQSR